MKYPQMDEYHNAIQTPRVAFEDSDLKGAKTDTDQFGIPKVSSGGFALTYRLNSGERSWAVRCFHKDAKDRRRRYDEISQFLNANPKPFFVKSEYLAKGIRVQEDWYPVTKMPWVQGETLYKFIEKNRADTKGIRSLADQFRQLVSSLQSLGVAHGDLQHGNILVSKGQLVLVDYDCMYVPQLKDLRSEERGHVNYQHPARTDQFDATIDRFSSIVIFLALRAITSDNWRQYGTGENLLFRRDDFRDPDASQLLKELQSNTELKSHIPNFRRICQSDLADVPTLDDFLSGSNLPALRRSQVRLSTRQNQYQVVDAVRSRELLSLAGQRITVIGKVEEYFHSRFSYDHQGPPYCFLNFGDFKEGAFTLVLWSEVLDMFASQRIRPESYVDKWVSVTGLVRAYSSPKRKYANPQIVIEAPSEIEVLPNEDEALKRLRIQHNNPKVVPEPVAVRPQVVNTTVATGQKNKVDEVERMIGEKYANQTSRKSTAQDFGELEKLIDEILNSIPSMPARTLKPQIEKLKQKPIVHTSGQIQPLPKKSGKIEPKNIKKWWEFWK